MQLTSNALTHLTSCLLCASALILSGLSFSEGVYFHCLLCVRQSVWVLCTHVDTVSTAWGFIAHMCMFGWCSWITVTDIIVHLLMGTIVVIYLLLLYCFRKSNGVSATSPPYRLFQHYVGSIIMALHDFGEAGSLVTAAHCCYTLALSLCQPGAT